MNYIYKLLDKEQNVLYVGKTNDLKRRFAEHMANQEWYYEIDSMYYAICRDSFEQSTYEKYYIIKSNPKYNRQDTLLSTNIRLPEIKWHKFENTQDFEKDTELRKKVIFLLDNWNLLNEMIDETGEMVADVIEPLDIDIYKVYTVQALIEELDKRRNKK